jgi:hypothetical protein
VQIALEELGLEYKVIPVDIGAGDQFKPEFLKITPNHRIPALVDSDGPGGKPFTLFESATILIYLSERNGGKLIPKDPIGRYKCLEWMMFQMGGVGPMFGQWNHFASYAVERIPYAIERYTNEVKRLHRCSSIAWRRRIGLPATNTAWPTSLPSRGSAGPNGATSASPTTPRSSAGTTKSRRARRCNAASRCWPTGSGRFDQRHRTREPIRRDPVRRTLTHQPITPVALSSVTPAKAGVQRYTPGIRRSGCPLSRA